MNGSIARVGSVGPQVEEMANMHGSRTSAPSDGPVLAAGFNVRIAQARPSSDRRHSRRCAAVGFG